MKPFDAQEKAYWWAITAYNEDIETLTQLLEGKSEFPTWLKKIYGGKERCPTTGRIHGQICLNTTQVRGSQVKKFLPQSHIEIACKKDDVIKYAMKEETAVDEKGEASNPKYCTLESLMEMIALQYLNKHGAEHTYNMHELYPDKDRGYDELSFLVVRENRYLANLCSQPQSQRCWVKYGEAFIEGVQTDGLWKPE